MASRELRIHMCSVDELLDLLSAWQSLHAILPLHLRAKVDNLNEKTIAALEAGAE